MKKIFIFLIIGILMCSCSDRVYVTNVDVSYRFGQDTTIHHTEFSERFEVSRKVKDVDAVYSLTPNPTHELVAYGKISLIGRKPETKHTERVVVKSPNVEIIPVRLVCTCDRERKNRKKK